MKTWLRVSVTGPTENENGECFPILVPFTRRGRFFSPFISPREKKLYHPSSNEKISNGKSKIESLLPYLIVIAARRRADDKKVVSYLPQPTCRSRPALAAVESPSSFHETIIYRTLNIALLNNIIRKIYFTKIGLKCLLIDYAAIYRIFFLL